MEIAITAILHDGVLIPAGESVEGLPEDAKVSLREVGSIGTPVVPVAVADELAAKDAQIAELKALLEAASNPAPADK